VVIPIFGIQRGILDAVNFARSISDEGTAVYVELESDAGEKARLEWESWWSVAPMVVITSPYRLIDRAAAAISRRDRPAA